MAGNNRTRGRKGAKPKKGGGAHGRRGAPLKPQSRSQVKADAPRSAGLQQWTIDAGKWIGHKGRKALSVALAAAGLLGLAAYPTAFPKVSITPSTLRDESDPLSFPFVVINDGEMAMEDVRIDCIPIKLGDSMTFQNLVLGLERVPRLSGRGGKHTEMCGGSFNVFGPAPYATTGVIDITVSYKPSWYFTRLQKRFRFISSLNSQKTVEWMEQAIPEDDKYLILSPGNDASGNPIPSGVKG